MRKARITNAELRLLLREQRTATSIENGKHVTVINEDDSIAIALLQINKAIAWVMKAPLPPFKVVEKHRTCVIEMSHGLNLLLSAASAYIGMLAYRASRYALNPKGVYLLNALGFVIVDQINTNNCHLLKGDSARKLVKEMNDAVVLMQTYFKGSECKRRMNDFAKNSKDNFRSLIRYFDSLFRLKSRYLIVRLDLEYRSSSQVLEGAAVSVSYEEARHHRERFFQKVSRRHSEIDGYVWKLEHGLDRGYHYHVVFFIDSRKNPQDVTVARNLGRIWEDEITNGIGFSYNCNAVKSKYKSCGIGMIDHHNQEAMDGLVNIAMYLTKQDEFMKLKLDGQERTLGKGLIKSQLTKKTGRPRLHESARIMA